MVSRDLPISARKPGDKEVNLSQSLEATQNTHRQSLLLICLITDTTSLDCLGALSLLIHRRFRLFPCCIPASSRPPSHLSLTSLRQRNHNGVETFPDRCPERALCLGSTRFAELHRLSAFARYQSLCLVAANHRMRRPVVWKKLRAGGNFWRIVSSQK